MVNKIDWNYVLGYFEFCNRFLVVKVYVFGIIEVDRVVYVYLFLLVFYFYEI